MTSLTYAVYEPGTAMADKRDPRGLKSSRGMTPGELQPSARERTARNRVAARQHNKLAQPQNRWQRFVRYAWDKKRG